MPGQGGSSRAAYARGKGELEGAKMDLWKEGRGGKLRYILLRLVICPRLLGHGRSL